MRAAIFDLDGTLADTSQDLIAAANAALSEDGRPGRLATPEDASVAFAGGRAMLRAGLARSDCGWDESDVDRLYPRLLDHYAASIDTHTRLYDGAERALTRLAAQGWALAVCTNKPEALAEALLRRLGVRDRFGAMLGADSRPFRKPDPRHVLETVALLGGAPARSVLIGDTVTDRRAAAAAGVACVLVGFGPSASAIADLAPDAIVGHFDELDAVLEALLPET